MNKIIFSLGIFLLVALVACAPAEEVTETTVTEEPQEAGEQPAVEEPNVTTTGNATTAAATVPGCVDGDNGLNTQFPSDVVDITGEKFYDKCEDSKTLLERKCGKDGKVATSRVGCLYGCVDGACNAPPAEPEEEQTSGTSGSSSQTEGDYLGSTAHCTDTDGGLTYDVQGSCTDAQLGNLRDTCIDDSTLIEWSCHRTQDKCVQQMHECGCLVGQGKCS